jgi:hypothetical protein
MESILLAHISVSADDIRQLATQRAAAVKDYLLAQHLSADRVFIGAAKTTGTDTAGNANTAAGSAKPASAASPADPATTAPWTPHAQLQLDMR